MTGFGLNAVPQSAQRAISRTRIVWLAVEDQRRLAEALLAPPPANDALRRAMMLHAENVEIR